MSHRCFLFYTHQDDHFKGLTNLRHLILANNQLHSISPHACDDFLSTLEDLDLSYNNLDEVPWDTIGRLTNVNTLNMDHNLIENVPQGVFTNLHKLARWRICLVVYDQLNKRLFSRYLCIRSLLLLNSLNLAPFCLGSTWHQTSWRKYLQTLCSLESQFMPSRKAPHFPPWCWVLVATPFTVTVNYYGWEDWPEKMTWRRALLLKTSVPSIFGQSLKR